MKFLCSIMEKHRMAKKTRYDLSILRNLEENVADKYIICRYILTLPAGEDLLKSVGELALSQSVGTWVPTSESHLPEVRKHAAKVIEIYDLPAVKPEKRRVLYQVGLNAENLGNSISMLLNAAGGYIGLTRELRWIDVRFPKGFTSAFKGPKFGSDGIRKYLGVHGRPLVGAVIKPKGGCPTKVYAGLAYQAAAGGCDLVKDDELMGAAAPYCPLEERLPAVMESLDKAEEETGEKTLYATNIVDDGKKLFENADKVLEAGGNCIMITPFTVGYHMARALADDPSINVPIFEQLAMSGSVSYGRVVGVGRSVLLKIGRLCGFDFLTAGGVGGKIPPRFKFGGEYAVRRLSVITAPFHHIKPCMPVVGAGLHAGLIPLQLNHLGTDTLIVAGGGIFGHPGGSTAGARSMRQAVDAYMKGIPLEKAAEDHEELKAAIDLWGTGSQSP